jgi:hypothetical protein
LFPVGSLPCNKLEFTLVLEDVQSNRYTIMVCDSFILGIPSCFVSNLQNHKNTVHQEPSTCLACALQLVYIYIHIHVQIKKYAQILSFIFSFDPNNIFMFFSPFSCMTFVQLVSENERLRMKHI